MADEKIKFLLFDRRIIGKYDNNHIYKRNVEEHTWEYSSYYTHKYLYTNDMVEEEIDYDEDKEEILSIRRAEGTWTTEESIESCKPSPQVVRFFERTGITYTDIYGSFGKKGAVQTSQTVNMLFESFPDLLAGAPGYTPIKPYTSEMFEKWIKYLSNVQECPQEWLENQYGKYDFRDDKSMKLYVFQIPLEAKRYWFLTIFVSYDDPSNKLKVKNYSLDYEDAEDSHYEFMVTEGEICKEFGIAPDHKRMYLHEYFCEYIAGGSGGPGLLSRLSPYITAEYHFD